MKAEIQTIKKTVAVNAPKEKVWDVLLQDNFNRIWFAAFSEGTYADTDWQLGSKVKFIDNSSSGLVGKVVVNRPYEVISVEYTGLVEAGNEDYESQVAKEMKGSRETYRLIENEGFTTLAIESDMSEEYFDMMSAAWDNALEKIKQLAEK